MVGSHDQIQLGHTPQQSFPLLRGHAPRHHYLQLPHVVPFPLGLSNTQGQSFESRCSWTVFFPSHADVTAQLASFCSPLDVCWQTTATMIVLIFKVELIALAL